MIALLLSLSAWAGPTGDNAIEVTAGLDDAIVALTVGYARRLHEGPVDASAGAEIAAPLLRPDLADWRATAWGGATVHAPHDLALPLRIGVRVLSTRNETYKALSLGTRVVAEPGWYRPRFSVAAVADWRQSWLTHIRSSDFYRDTYYPDAPDGWYGGTGHEVRLGGHVRWALSPAVWLGVAAGWQGNGRYDVLVPGLYATADLVVGFPDVRPGERATPRGRP